MCRYEAAVRHASVGIAAAAFADERYILVLARPVLPRCVPRHSQACGMCVVELLIHSDV
jgi:hypothetical protein